MASSTWSLVRKMSGLPFRIGEGVDFGAVRALAIRYPAGLDWKTIDHFDPPQFNFDEQLVAE